MAFFTTSLRRAGATRVLAAASLALALAACGESAPTSFDAAGTAADVDAANAAFTSPAVTSFVNLSTAMDATTGGSSASVGALAVRGRSPDLFASSKQYAAAVRRFVPGTATPQISASVGEVVPVAVRGKTFVYDPAQSQYVVSDRSGAPANGVRFILYAVDPVSGAVVTPLVETGAADLTDLSSGSTTSARLQVLSGSTVYLDYTAAGTVGLSSAKVTVNGFATNGTERADFDLVNTFTHSDASDRLALDYGLELSKRDVKLHYVITLDFPSGGSEGTLGLDLSLKGPNGWVDVDGHAQSTGGTFTVKVNGKDFATITSTSGDPTTGGDTITITGKNGQALTSEEQQTLGKIWQMVSDGLEVFAVLLEPLAHAFAS
jgi:hypothetical protein